MTVTLTQTSQKWWLEYTLDAAGESLQYADMRSSAGGSRVDGLWRETCCEIFIAGESSQDGAYREGTYLEFNFSPSGDWAAYAFDAPRQGMRAHLWQGEPPRIERLSTGATVSLRVALPVDALVGLDAARVGLAAVMKTDRGLSYWALRHPGPQPDFHHPGSFSPLPRVRTS